MASRNATCPLCGGDFKKCAMLFEHAGKVMCWCSTLEKLVEMPKEYAKPAKPAKPSHAAIERIIRQVQAGGDGDGMLPAKLREALGLDQKREAKREAKE